MQVLHLVHVTVNGVCEASLPLCAPPTVCDSCLVLVLQRSSPHDVGPALPLPSPSFSGHNLTTALASITAEARRDEALAERVAHWKDIFRERGV